MARHSCDGFFQKKFRKKGCEGENFGSRFRYRPLTHRLCLFICLRKLTTDRSPSATDGIAAASEVIRFRRQVIGQKRLRVGQTSEKYMYDITLKHNIIVSFSTAIPTVIPAQRN